MRPCRAESASPGSVEKCETPTTFEPNAITATRSVDGLPATKPRAAAIASTNDLPCIEYERSIASTTDFDDARLSAVIPAARSPFSVRAGLTPGPALDTTVPRIVG